MILARIVVGIIVFAVMFSVVKICADAIKGSKE